MSVSCIYVVCQSSLGTFNWLIERCMGECSVLPLIPTCFKVNNVICYILSKHCHTKEQKRFLNKYVIKLTVKYKVKKDQGDRKTKQLIPQLRQDLSLS